MSEPKLCVQCRHMRDRDCIHPNNVKQSMVDGVMGPVNTLHYLRQRHSDSYQACEPEGRWWEPNVQVAEAA